MYIYIYIYKYTYADTCIQLCLSCVDTTNVYAYTYRYHEERTTAGEMAYVTMRLDEAFSKFMPASLASPRESLVAWGKSVRSRFNLGVIVCVCEYRISESTCMY